MPTNPDPDLMRIFDFTVADLEANRAGHVTNSQLQRLSNRVNKNRRFLIFTAISIPICIVLSVALALVSDHSIKVEVITRVPLRVGIPLTLFLWVLFLVVIFFERRNLKLDVKAGIVAYTQGTLKRWSTRGGGSIKIGGVMLDIESAENLDLKAYLKKVPKDTQFRVYFVPNSKMVVAMETCAK